MMTAGITRAEATADALRGAILRGTYVSGERLVEVKIAQALDVSQNTVRDALRLLEQEGWVIKHARRGAYVRSFSADEADEIGTLIAAVETVALGWAIERLDKLARAELAALIAAARKFSYAGDPQPAFEQLVCFHERIGEAAGKPLTAQLLESLYNQVRLLETVRQARTPRTTRELAARIEQHESLLRLIDSGDRDAAMRQLAALVASYSASLAAALRV